jgi:hypothetical protein
MVHNLSHLKEAANLLLHDEPVLVYITAAVSGGMGRSELPHIPTCVKHPAARICRVAFPSLRNAETLEGAKPRRLSRRRPVNGAAAAASLACKAVVRPRSAPRATPRRTIALLGAVLRLAANTKLRWRPILHH